MCLHLAGTDCPFVTTQTGTEGCLQVPTALQSCLAVSLQAPERWRSGPRIPAGTHPHFLFLRGLGRVVWPQALRVEAVPALVALQQLLQRKRAEQATLTDIQTFLLPHREALFCCSGANLNPANSELPGEQPTPMMPTTHTPTHTPTDRVEATLVA